MEHDVRLPDDCMKTIEALMTSTEHSSVSDYVADLVAREARRRGSPRRKLLIARLKAAEAGLVPRPWEHSESPNYLPALFDHLDTQAEPALVVFERTPVMVIFRPDTYRKQVLNLVHLVLYYFGEA